MSFRDVPPASSGRGGGVIVGGSETGMGGGCGLGGVLMKACKCIHESINVHLCQ